MQSINCLPTVYREQRPWGSFMQFVANTPCTIKILSVAASQALSLQYHKGRDEFWMVIKGKGTFLVGEKEQKGCEGDTFFVPRYTQHRIAGGEEGVHLKSPSGTSKKTISSGWKIDTVVGGSYLTTKSGRT